MDRLEKIDQKKKTGRVSGSYVFDLMSLFLVKTILDKRTVFSYNLVEHCFCLRAGRSNLWQTKDRIKEKIKTESC